VSLAFLSPSSSALCRSPMERQARAAGARFEERDGWTVAVGFDGAEAERQRLRSTVGFADMSHLGKVEVQGPQAGGLELGTARLEDGEWWLPYTPARAIVLCDAGRLADLRGRLDGAAAVEPALASVTRSRRCTPSVPGRSPGRPARCCARPRAAG
jgi:aminomethyltransferase folate-binding domain-containing protein